MEHACDRALGRAHEVRERKIGGRIVMSEGQGLLLELTWLRARYASGYHDKVESRMKQGSQQLMQGKT